MSFEIPLHRARRYIAHTLRQTQRQIKRVARGKIKSVSQSRHFLQANKTFSFPYEVLCHCETPLSGVVAISRKGTLLPMAVKCLRRDIAFAVICLRRDICPAGKLWINTLTSAVSRNITSTKSRNITLTKSKYNLRSNLRPRKILLYLRGEKRRVRRCQYDNGCCQYSQHITLSNFKKIFKKFELNKTKNGGFPKSDFPFPPENTSVLTKRRRFCIIKL